MQRLVVLAAVVALTLSLPAAGQSGGANPITNPVWTTPPAGGVLPPQVSQTGYSPLFPLLCRVHDAVLEDCRPATDSSTPDLLGAARTAAQAARIAPEDAEHGSTEGREVALVIYFPLAIRLDPPPSPPPAVLTGVIWKDRPTAQQFDQNYPADARRQHLSGRVVLDCIIAQNGMVACTVLSEAPAGESFGAAALRVSRYFRAAAQTQAGEATADHNTRISLTFNPPG